MLILASVVTAAVNADAASVTLQWAAPTTNVDGSPLTDLSGYRIYFATSAPACPSGSFFTVASSTTTPAADQTVSTGIAGLNAGTTYFARVTAVDNSGNESTCSAAATGVAQADFSVTPSTATGFGSIATGSTADRTFTVQNTSGSSISGTVSIGAPFNILSGGSFSLAPGGSQTVTVRFAPTTAGTFAGNVNFTAGGDTVSRAVNGSATEGTTLTLSVTKSGTGSGTVTSTPAGINCGATCSQSVTPGTAITLTATPAAGSAFAGWSGACSGTGACPVTVNAAATVTATFNVALPSLPGDPGTPSATQVAADANGVTFAVIWTAGSGATSYRYSAGFTDGTGGQQGSVPTTSMQLRMPYHSSGSASGGFACAQSVNTAGPGTGQSCATLQVPARPVTAVPLSVTKSGPGSGTVTSSPAGINCGATCSQSVTPGTTVTLTATPAAGSAFAGWSGACSGTGACAVTVNAATSVTATFNLLPVTLSVGKAGSGSGTVTSSPAGINCGATCSQSVTPGTAITLTATPAAGSAFAGWSGACSGVGICAVTVNSATGVGATFDTNPVDRPFAPNPTPLASSLSPATAPAGSAATMLTVNGSGFVPTSMVRWNGVARTTTFVSKTQLQATITKTDLANARSVPVTVFSPTPGGGTSGAVSFGITSSSTPPAAPGWPSVMKLSADMSGVTFAVAWTPVTGGASYRYSAGFSDGTAAQQGMVTVPSLQLRMPYYVTGAAASGFVCVASVNEAGQQSTSLACNAVAVPARPSTPTSTPPAGAPRPSGLVAAYAFDETSGSTVTDISGNNNTGTLGSGVLRTNQGRFGGALLFNGNDLVTVPNSPSLNLTTGMTLEAWVFPTASTNWAATLMKEQPGGLAYSLYASSSSSRPIVYFNTGKPTTRHRYLSGPAALPLNTWSHLAATYDGATLRLYLNGAQVSSQPHTGSIITSTGALRIGGDSAGEFFQGLIDEIRIYNRALSPSEILTDMSTGVGPRP